MTAPTATATLSKAAYAPGEAMVLTVDHTDADRQTITVSGVVRDSTGAEGTWTATATIDDGAVEITSTGGKTWAIQSATPTRTVFTATA